jgi:hypothetical protein
MAEVGAQIAQHNQKISDIDDEILAFKATASISASPGAPALLKKLEKEKSEEVATLTSLVRYLRGVLAKELVDEEHMTVHDINALLDFLPEIERICKKSADFGIQQTLINADFNENNVILNKTTSALSIIDWGESVISHPFLTIASHLRSLSRRYNLDLRRGLLAEIKEVCFSCWLDLASQTACAELYEDILKLQPVFSALAIKRLQNATQNKSKNMQTWFIKDVLKDLLKN